MTGQQIYKLISEGEFPEPTGGRELIETHISWVILCDDFVYKIKKPIRYSFLDFHSLEQRKYYCEKELELNRRYAGDVYLEVLPIHEVNGKFRIGKIPGNPVGYALKMRKLDPGKRLDKLLKRGEVGPEDIKALAIWIANFHQNAPIVYKENILDIREKFNDLDTQVPFVAAQLGEVQSKLILQGIETSNQFLQKNEKGMEARMKAGFYRDCHGDLHTRNIFLLPAPQPFDCLEFNDEFRKMDVLDEVAFLCMDLDALHRSDLSELCMQHYNLHYPAIRTVEDQQFFIYYKAYRANIRAKVNSLRASSQTNEAQKNKALADTKKYLGMMEGYLNSISET